ncbi:DsbA family protein [Colwellia demingiae]|uniref:DsbA family protein n=1 Tax=Colwellia demingiae TaxID=89401 RepID=A0A5C6QK65_9GAMM|nr:DsbA family protein [Colwellia demingiae]TWX69596.1 DsbA family protein [Colwellia demingiae]
MSTKLYYIYDPMCSWCWGYRPVWDLLQQNLPKSIMVEYVAGGLAPDSDSAMPIAQQQMIQNHWRTIEQKLGTRFNHDFWRDNTPKRSTYNSCRAAIAAHKQSCQKPMIDAIQQAYYLRALNPSNVDILITVAKELSQQVSNTLDLEQFIADINSSETDKELARQVNLARELSQQGFPSLVLEVDGVIQQIPLDYSDYKATLAYIIKKAS